MADKGGSGSGGQKSSGPSSNDPGVGGSTGGTDFGAGSQSGAGGYADFGTSGPPNANTGGAAVGGDASPPPTFGFGIGGALDPGSSSPFGGSSPLGGATPGSPASVTSSIGTPGGFTGAAAPAATSPTGSVAGGFGGGPSDLSSAFYDPNNPNSSPFSAGGQGGGTTTQLSASQLGAPQVAPSSPANATAGGTVNNNQSAGSKSILDSLGIKNPLGAAIGAGGLAYSAIEGQKAAKFSPELQAQAANLDANGRQLMSYLQSGNLPPGLQAWLTQATSAAKAKIISNFASQGLNTDPSQNSALAAELAAVDQQALISTAQIGQQLMTQGIAESGLSSDLYKTLANIDQTQTAAIGKAIANFAASLSGGGGGLNLSLGKV